MLGNSFGTLFRITSFGESHGPAIGVIIDGCPSGLTLSTKNIEEELKRRRPGQSNLVSSRNEADAFEVLSGVFEGITTGSPIMVLVRNEDVKSKDYLEIKNLFRPGHADYTYFAKYQHRDYRGGGRASARETVARVIGGAIAKQILSSVGISIQAGVVQIGKVKAKQYSWEEVKNNDIRSVDPLVVENMRREIEEARKARDSVGGAIEVVATGVPAGLGEPVFSKLDAAIASALMSIPAVKGVEIGAGFSSVELLGSEMNDEMYPDGFHTNNHGGILGGISSGAPIVCRIAIKPTSSIPKEQNTLDTEFNARTISTKGRHDACVAIRAVPIAEAMVSLVLVDFWLINLSHVAAKEHFAPAKVINYGLKKSDR
jgi:chorismate synthase